MQSQLLKGVLESCILKLISGNEIYGYQISSKLMEHGFKIKDGSIYPILLRLEKEKCIQGRMKVSQKGPNRKYYSITEIGREKLVSFYIQWNQLQHLVGSLIGKENEDEITTNG